MNKKVPKIFINKIDKVNNNKEVFYSFKNNNFEYEKKDNIQVNEFDIQNKIDKLFRTNDFIYKKTFHIKTKYSENDYTIISKSYNYLLTIDGSRIYIKDIIDIY
mgnify:FL=1